MLPPKALVNMPPSHSPRNTFSRTLAERFPIAAPTRLNDYNMGDIRAQSSIISLAVVDSMKAEDHGRILTCGTSGTGCSESGTVHDHRHAHCPHGIGSASKQHPLKNLLREADQMLTSLHRDDARMILEPAQNLFSNEDLFQRSGLVMFLSVGPGDFRYYPVEIQLEEKVVVAEQYYTRPLLPLLTTSGSFYVLTLS